MFRTPAKKPTEPSPPNSPPKAKNMATIIKTQTNVRRNVGEWETGKVLFQEKSPINVTQTTDTTATSKAATPPGPMLKTVRTQKPFVARAGRVQEARACVTRAKTALSASRNLKTDIKADVTRAIDRLYQLVKEDEAEGSAPHARPVPTCVDRVGGADDPLRQKEEGLRREEEWKGESGKIEMSQLLSSLAEHTKLMRESNERAESLKEALEIKRESLEAITYASVAASAKGRKRPVPAPLHSVVVASRDDMETGEEVLGRIRRAVNAKQGDVQIDRVRKSKDRKVVISCRSEEQRNTIRNKIEEADKQLEVQDVKNLDPLIILRDVLSSHSDEEVLQFLRVQNKKLFQDLPAGDDRIDIKFRKRARNEIICHMVARVSPTLWNRLLGASEVYVDLQHIRVEDQSPLVQCSMCLGYGHSRRLCTETTEKCGYCGGPHQRRNCAEKLANVAPTCCNCAKEKLETTGHTVFSTDCPVRRRWETLARAKIAYC